MKRSRHIAAWLWAVAVAALILGVMARAEPPPPPTYAIYNDGLSVGGSGFVNATEGGAHIESVYGSRWQTSGQPLPPIQCTASAERFRNDEFDERGTPYAESAFAGPKRIFFNVAMCARYANPGSSVCVAIACARPGETQYQMYAQCPSASLAFKEPASCICTGVGNTWHGATGRCVPVVERNLTRSRPKHCPYGNPVYPMTGARMLSVPLGVEVGGVELKLTYSSVGELPGNELAVTPRTQQMPAFGPLWSGSFHRYLVTPPGTHVGAGLVAVRGDGLEQGFFPNGAGGLVSADASNANDLFGTAGYRDRVNLTVETSYAGAPLQSVYQMHRASGVKLSFGYGQTLGGPEVFNSPGTYLVRVTDSFGRSARFEYANDSDTGFPRVTRILRPDNSVITLGYVAGMLASITWPDNSSQRFVYEHGTNKRLLTGRIDEGERRIGTYTYDEAGRATATEGAGGVDAHRLVFATPPSVLVQEQYDPRERVIYRTRTFVPAAAVTVTDPLGARYGLIPAASSGDSVGGRNQPGGSGCDAATEFTAYDARSNVVRRDDFVGTRSCYAYDASNRETIRVEGLPGGPQGASCDAALAPAAALPADSRKTTTEWHPLWKLPVKVAEPGVLTTHVYHGRPDPFNNGASASCAPFVIPPPSTDNIAVLCRKVRQATTDANGSQGLNPSLQPGVPRHDERWTYNTLGQVLTATDARNQTTRYTYHPGTTAEYTQGDLQTLTDPAGHVTRYTRYNAFGQLLEKIDPNNVVTRHTYDLRLRLTSTDIGGQLTSHAYWPHGRLKKTTEADGSYTGYGYDDAQRLRTVQDSLGNRVEYELDNAGNRTAEAVTDPTGRLRRQFVRQFDALGRVQQTTGRE